MKKVEGLSRISMSRCRVEMDERVKSGWKNRRVLHGIALLALAMPPCVALAEDDESDRVEHTENEISPWLAYAFGLQRESLGDMVTRGTARYDVRSQLAIVTSSNYGNATVQGNENLALGSRADVNAERSVAYGNMTYVRGQGSVGIGFNAMAYTAEATAIGASAVVSGYGGVAVGSGALASGDRSIALGRGSVADEGSTLSVGSKGSAGITRRIVNVTEGRLNASSNDAVTGRQLFATNTEVAGVKTTAETAKTASGTALTRADDALAKVGSLSGLIMQAGPNADIRLGGENTGAVVDFANKNGAKRHLRNVANAALNATSGDAVTGQQLFATNSRLDVHESALMTHDEALDAHNSRIYGNRVDLDKLRAEFDASGGDLERVVRYEEDGSIDVKSGRLRSVSRGDASSATSTDAVNGGQLYESNQRIDAVEKQGRFTAIGGGGDQEQATAGQFAVAIGDSARASVNAEGGVAIGAYAEAGGKNSVALGRASSISDDAYNAFALGTRSLVEAANGVAIGADAYIKPAAEMSVAVGAASVASEARTVSFGNDAFQRRLVNVARGTSSTDAATVAQLSDILSTFGTGASVDAQGRIIAPIFRVGGGTQASVGEALTVLDAAVTGTDSRVETIERQLRAAFDPSSIVRTDGVNQLTLAGANGMVLSNVANGAIAAGSRDAVNGGQLHAVQQQLNGRIDGIQQDMNSSAGANRDPQAVAAQDTLVPGDEKAAESAAGDSPAGTPKVASAQDESRRPRATENEAKAPQTPDDQLQDVLTRANAYADGMMQEVEQRLDKMDKRFNRMAAMNSAQSAMAMNTAGLATYNRVGAGVGHSEGESALAVGYQRVLNERGSATFSLSGAFTNSGERTVGVGVGIGW